MSWIREFKAFALRGNVVDLAVGMIIGGTFSGIVNSAVRDLIMPVVGLFTGGLDFSQKFIRLGHLPADFEGNPTSFQDLQAAGVPVFGYGNFITVLIHFLILALIVFLIVKGINQLHRTAAQSSQSGVSPAPSEEILLLREIRDALKNGTICTPLNK